MPQAAATDAGPALQRYAPFDLESSFKDRQTLFEAFARHVSPGKAAYYEKYGFDVVMGPREGVRFQDAFSGRSFINCHSNGGVFNLGHKNPRVVARVRTALDSLDIGNHHLVSPHRTELAKRLAATTGGRLEGVVFGVGGGEAVDLAIKVARGATGRAKVVSARGGYHGHTGLAMAAGDAAYRDPFGPSIPSFVQVPFDDTTAMEDALAGEDVAAVVLEPVPATLGMPIPSADYLRSVQETCHRRGTMLILDEVQTGLGRTGRIWCHQHDDLDPDVVVTGKGLSGGIFPITATLMTRSLHDLFLDHPFAHISTFGGAELGCVAALEVLDVIEAPGFLERVEEAAERIRRGVAGLSFQLRAKGLMMGLAFGVEDAGLMAAKMLYDEGIFALYANNDTSVLQFLPPLTITDEEIDEILAVLRRLFA